MNTEIPDGATLPSAPEPNSDLLQIDKKEKTAILEKIKEATDESDKLSARRKVNFEAWTRAPYKEEPDRSRYQAADVFDQVESTFPALMGRVLATDHQIRVRGPEQLVAKALVVKVRSILDENDSFRLYSCAIKDGLLSVFGCVKLWWSKRFRLVYDQRSRLPQEAVAMLEQERDAGNIADLQVEQDPGPTVAVHDPQDGITGPIIVPVPPTFSVTIGVHELEESKCVILPIPPEQVLMQRGKASINDSKGCGHKTVMTVGEVLEMQDRLSTPTEPFFEWAALLEAIKRGSKDESSHHRDEREARENLNYTVLEDGSIDFALTSAQLRQPITFVEWSDSVVAGDRMENALLWYGGDVCLRVQKNREGIVPMCGWSPFMVPHSVIGMGIAEQHVHQQDMRSGVGRAYADSIARAVDDETFVLNEATDIMGLRRRVPGQLVYAEPGKDFVRVPPNTLDAKLLQFMEWVKGETHDTGPSNRWTQGRDVDPRNTTATGQQIMAAASSSKQNMIALVFTEIFQVDLYQKIIKLLQANCDEFTVTVEDQVITLTNAQIQGNYIAYSETGRQFDLNDRELMRSQLVHGLVKDLAAAGITGPEQLHASAKKVLLAAGEPVTSDYLLPPGVTLQQMIMQQAQQLLQQQMAQMTGAPMAGPAGAGAPPMAAAAGGSSQPDMAMDQQMPVEPGAGGMQ